MAQGIYPQSWIPQQLRGLPRKTGHVLQAGKRAPRRTEEILDSEMRR